MSRYVQSHIIEKTLTIHHYIEMMRTPRLSRIIPIVQITIIHRQRNVAMNSEKKETHNRTCLHQSRPICLHCEYFRETNVENSSAWKKVARQCTQVCIFQLCLKCCTIVTRKHVKDTCVCTEKCHSIVFNKNHGLLEQLGWVTL